MIGDRAALMLEHVAGHHSQRPAQEREPAVDLDEARLAEQPAEDGPRRLARIGARAPRSRSDSNSAEPVTDGLSRCPRTIAGSVSSAPSRAGMVRAKTSGPTELG